MTTRTQLNGQITIIKLTSLFLTVISLFFNNPTSFQSNVSQASSPHDRLLKLLESIYALMYAVECSSPTFFVYYIILYRFYSYYSWFVLSPFTELCIADQETNFAFVCLLALRHPHMSSKVTQVRIFRYHSKFFLDRKFTVRTIQHVLTFSWKYSPRSWRLQWPVSRKAVLFHEFISAVKC